MSSEIAFADDYAGGLSTSGFLVVNGQLTGSITAVGDRDWVRVELEAGNAYQFDLLGNANGGGTLADTFLVLYDRQGTPLIADDDGASAYDQRPGHSTSSQIVFRPSESGPYFLEASGFAGVLGTYTLHCQTLPMDYHFRALLGSQVVSWNSTKGRGTPVSVTYSFPEELLPDFLGGPVAGFVPFTAAQRDAVRQILRDISDLTLISFVERVGESGQIKFVNAELDHAGGATWWKSNEDLLTAADIALDLLNGQPRTPSPGNYAYMALIHEIGHALGLKHPGNYDASGGGASPPYLPSSQDVSLFTVESYNFTTAYLDLKTNAYNYVTSMMSFDVAALQHLYGANLDARSQDDDWKPVAATQYTIWDAGGTDTLDASAWDTSGVSIYLDPGMVSYAGLLTSDTLDNGLVPLLSIAYGSEIENAVGTLGDDLLVGNVLANLIQGGKGADRLVGGSGDDTLAGGAGVDRLFGNAGRDVFVLTVDSADVIEDFEAGPAGDSLALDVVISSLSGLLAGQDPFDAGYLKLFSEESGLRLCLQVVGAQGQFKWSPISVMPGVHALDFQRENVGGLRPNFAATGTVTIEGRAEEGAILFVRASLSDPEGETSPSFQWLADGVPLLGATEAQLLLSSEVVGKRIGVAVSFLDGHGSPERVAGTETLPVTSAPIPDRPLTLEIKITAWNGSGPLPGTVLGMNGNHRVTADADGRAMFDLSMVEAGSLQVGRPVPMAEMAATTAAVDVSDASDILRLIVGLGVGSESSKPSALQSLAADVDGDGSVALADAIAVLRHVVGLESDAASWRFVNPSGLPSSFPDPLMPGLAPAMEIDPRLDPTGVMLVGVLAGDVNGSFTPPGP